MRAIEKVLSPSIIIFFCISLFFVLVVLPLYQHSWTLVKDVYDHKRIFEITFVLLNIFLFLLNKRLTSTFLNLWSAVPAVIRCGLWGILIIGLLSTFFADYPRWALLQITHYSLLFTLSLIVAVYVKLYPVVMKQVVIAITVAFAVMYVGRIAVGYFKSLNGFYPVWPGGQFLGVYGFANIRIFNQIQTFTLPLLGVAVVSSRRYGKGMFTGFLLLLSAWWILVFVSGARGTLLAVTCAVTLAGFVYHSQVLKWLKVQLTAAFIGVVSYFFLFIYTSESVGRSVARGGSSGRLEFWDSTVTEILQQPWIGHGPMQLSIFGLELHGHNYFLTMAYGWGIPTAILFTAILAVALYKFFQNIEAIKEQSQKTFDVLFQVGLFAALTATWIHSLFTGLLSPALSLVWLVLCVGLAIGIYYKDKTQVDVTGDSYNWKLAPFIGITVGVFIWSVYPSLSNYKERQKLFIENYETTLRPGFWQQGKIGIDYEVLKESQLSDVKEP